jgi:hypothetical protein
MPEGENHDTGTGQVSDVHYKQGGRKMSAEFAVHFRRDPVEVDTMEISDISEACGFPAFVLRAEFRQTHNEARDRYEIKLFHAEREELEKIALAFGGLSHE